MMDKKVDIFHVYYFSSLFAVIFMFVIFLVGVIFNIASFKSFMISMLMVLSGVNYFVSEYIYKNNVK